MIETDKYGYSHVTNAELPATKSGYEENSFKPLLVWPDAVKRYLEILKKQRFFDELGK